MNAHCHKLLRIVVSVLILALPGCGDDRAVAPAPETLSGFHAAFAGVVVADQPFNLIVSAEGTHGTRPFTAFSGSVKLTLSAGTITPATFELAAGEGEVSATVSGVFGNEVVLTVTASGRSSDTTLPSVLLSRLLGDPESPASVSIPDFPLYPLATDYSEDHPELPGMGISHTLLMLAFEPGTSVASANELIVEHGAAVAGGLPGSPGGAPGVLFLRMPTTTHAELAPILDALASDARVRAVVQDVLLEETLVTESNGGTPSGWDWELTPTGGNWGLERIRAPQMWNLNAGIRKLARTTPTTIIDTGFSYSHPDLVLEVLGVQSDSRHGSHVAGIVGAGYHNRIGIDGVNPFARLSAMAPRDPVGVGSAWRTSWGETITLAIATIVRHRPDIRVINISLGYNWYKIPLDPSTSTAAQDIANNAGELLDMFLVVLAETRSLPLICVAAGNESRTTTPQLARWSSPMTNAAMVHETPAILVVENVADSPGSGTGDVIRSASSCIDGHISAPGARILSTGSGTSYATLTGTSMASPHVAGLVGYLLALDPTLTHTELVTLLNANSLTAAGGASPRIDAWASAVDIDRLRGNDTVLRMLVDVDDGTADGNQRIDYATGDEIVVPVVGALSGEGDGSVNMADFRRWRDWLLQAEDQAATSLDGLATNPKKDLNGDKRVEAAVLENVYPRGDFNGDGIISRIATSAYPGALGKDVTDLQVLQAAFSDAHTSVGELPTLIDSGDLTVDGSGLMGSSNVATGSVEIRRQDQTLVTQLVLSSGTQVVTLPSNAPGYEATASVFDSDGALLASQRLDFVLQPGADQYWRPSTLPVIVISVTAPPSAEPDVSFPVLIRAGLRALDGQVTYRAGIGVTTEATGGSILPPSGLTDADGYFSTEGSLTNALDPLTAFVTASEFGLEDVVAVFSVLPASSGGKLVVVEIPEEYSLYASRIYVHSWAATDSDPKKHPVCVADTIIVLDRTEVDLLTASADNSCSGSGDLGSADAAASVSIEHLVHWIGAHDEVGQIDLSASGSAVASGSPATGTGATSQGTDRFFFDVTGETVALNFSGSVTWTGEGVAQMVVYDRSDLGEGRPVPRWVYNETSQAGATVSVNAALILPPGEYMLLNNLFLKAYQFEPNSSVGNMNVTMTPALP